MAQPRVTHVLQTKRSEYPKHRNTRPWHICFLQFLLRKPKILTFLEAESAQLKRLSSRRPCGVNLCRALPATSRSVPVTLGWGGRGGGWGDAPPCGVNRIGRDIYPALGELQSTTRSTAIFIQTCSSYVNNTTICRLTPFNYLHPLSLRV